MDVIDYEWWGRNFNEKRPEGTFPQKGKKKVTWYPMQFRTRRKQNE